MPAGFHGNLTKLISSCDILSIHNREDEIESFDALIDNYFETNIRVLPLIEGLKDNKAKSFHYTSNSVGMFLSIIKKWKNLTKKIIKGA